MITVLVLNGPNLNRLGTREPSRYGTETLEDILRGLRARAAGLGVRLTEAQSQSEGDLVERILAADRTCQGVIFNPGAYTHTSVALRDALQAVSVPCVEVHLTNTAAREDFRRPSLTAGACLGQIMGFGARGYHLALIGLAEYLASRQPAARAAGRVRRPGRGRARRAR